MKPTTKASLSYLTWIAGVIVFATEQDPFIRKNAAQSIVLGGLMTLIALTLSWIPGVRYVVLIALLAYLILVAIAMIFASRGEMYHMPFVSDLANKIVE